MLYNSSNAVRCNKSKNQIHIIVIMKGNADKGVSLFPMPKTVKRVNKYDK